MKQNKKNYVVLKNIHFSHKIYENNFFKKSLNISENDS